MHLQVDGFGLFIFDFAAGFLGAWFGLVGLVFDIHCMIDYSGTPVMMKERHAWTA
jgi:hypothetical protein